MVVEVMAKYIQCLTVTGSWVHAVNEQWIVDHPDYYTRPLCGNGYVKAADRGQEFTPGPLTCGNCNAAFRSRNNEAMMMAQPHVGKIHIVYMGKTYCGRASDGMISTNRLKDSGRSLCKVCYERS